MKIELLGFIPLYYAIAIKIVACIIIGGLLGYERATKLKSMGMRSAMLLALGACLFTILTFISVDNNSNYDPNRVIAQLVSGLGFLSAAVIFRDPSGVVKGLTTGIEIWCIAALGAVVGVGYPFLALVLSLVILFILEIIPRSKSHE